jgi:hypothetical protein
MALRRLLIVLQVAAERIQGSPISKSARLSSRDAKLSRNHSEAHSCLPNRFTAMR